MERGPRTREDAGGTLSPGQIGRLSGALWALCGVLVVAAGTFVPLPPGANRRGVVVIGLVAVVCGVVIWFIPWERWRRSATLWIVPLAFAVIALHDRFTAGDGFVYATFYLVAFVWIGLGHPQGTSLRFLPLLAVAYAAPLIDMDMARSSLAVASAAYVLPSCVLVGETV